MSNKRQRNMEETLKLVNIELTEVLEKYDIKKIGYDLFYKHVKVEFVNILESYKADKSIYDYTFMIMPPTHDPFKVIVNLHRNPSPYDKFHQIELMVV